MKTRLLTTERKNAVDDKEKINEEVIKEGEEKKEVKPHKKNDKDELKAKIEALEAEKAELNDKLLRTAAEFDNFKKRTAKEKEELAVYAKCNCVRELLTVLDSFERAMETPCSDGEFKKGVEMILSQLGTSFEKLGVSEIEALNAQFDPTYHNAVNQIQDDSFDENTVAQVLQKGYKIGDKVIRHAMVIVANP